MRKRQVISRGEMPREKLASLAGKLSESPLKETLERIGAEQARRSRPKD